MSREHYLTARPYPVPFRYNTLQVVHEHVLVSSKSVASTTSAHDTEKGHPPLHAPRHLPPRSLNNRAVLQISLDIFKVE